MRQHEHDYKPSIRFFGKDSYWLGIELEVEAKDSQGKCDGLGVLKQPKWCFAKHDGSLSSYGWELVTQPISRKLWLQQRPKKTPVGAFFKLIDELRKMGYTSHTSGRCGLHIHVSWPAFEGIQIRRNINAGQIARRQLRRKHLYWFAKLINGALFQRLSQRDKETCGQWARQVDVKAATFHTIGYQDTRYIATNITANTLEVRIFRGNMREDRVRKAIEAVIAAVEFTRNVDYKEVISTKLHKPGKLDSAFANYVGRHSTTYPNLTKYLLELRVLQHLEDQEVPSCA
jgi:hypothetical protein